MSSRSIAITGATGFIGSELVRYYLEKEWRVIGMARNKIDFNDENFSYLYYVLENTPDFSRLEKVDAIIHCAYTPWKEDRQDANTINSKATMELAEFCKKTNKKFVFLSSFSAHEHASSNYGKHKLELEKKLCDAHLVIKPGLVLGNGGLYASMSKLVSEKKIIPVIGNGDYPIQVTTIEALCKSISYGIEKNFTGVYPIASAESISFLFLLEAIARNNNVSPFLIFIPVFLIRILLKLFNRKIPFSEENLKGLTQSIVIDTKESLEKFELEINPEMILKK